MTTYPEIDVDPDKCEDLTLAKRSIIRGNMSNMWNGKGAECGEAT